MGKLFGVAALGLVATASAAYQQEAYQCPANQYAIQPGKNCGKLVKEGVETVISKDFGKTCLVATFATGVACPTTPSAALAHEHCESRGMELCSTETLVSFGTGITKNGDPTMTSAEKATCNLHQNSRAWWTSDIGYLSSSAPFGIQTVSKWNEVKDVVPVSGSTARPVVCCSRNFENNMAEHCARCPYNTVAPAGSTSMAECTPVAGMSRVFSNMPTNGKSEHVINVINELSIGEFATDYENQGFRSCGAGTYASRTTTTCKEGQSKSNAPWTVTTSYKSKNLGPNTWWKKNMDTDVCAKTRYLDTWRDGRACPQRGAALMPFYEATAMCMANGARLCTEPEMSGDHTAGSGCDYNTARVWTQSPCTNKDGDEGIIVTSGAFAGRSRASEQCEADLDSSSTTARVRCCASDTNDSNPANFAICKACPAGYTSLAGAVGENECVPSPKTSCSQGSDYRGGSAERCSRLLTSKGFVSNGKMSNPDAKKVCYGSPFNGRCPHKATHAKAEKACRDIGARLCTPVEIIGGAGSDAGVCPSRAWYWTSASTLKSSVGVVVANGGSASREKSKRRRANFMCCADEGSDNSGDGHYCANCPEYNDGDTNGADGIEKCMPDAGFYRTYELGTYGLEFKETADGSDLVCGQNEYVSYTPKTCSQLGRRTAKQGRTKGTDRDTCAKAIAPCAAASQAEAKKRCDAAGARLCTLDELNAGEGNRAGCKFGNVPVWTAHSCNGGTGGVTRNGGVNAKRPLGNPQCMDVATEKAGVQCCADESAHCAACPAGTSTTSSRNEGGVEVCECSGANVMGPYGCALPTVYVEIGTGKDYMKHYFSLDLCGTTFGQFKAKVYEWSKAPQSTVKYYTGGVEYTQADGDSLCSAGIVDHTLIRVEQSCESYMAEVCNDDGKCEKGIYQKYACGDTACGRGKYLSGSKQSCSNLNLKVRNKPRRNDPDYGVLGGSPVDRQSKDRFCGTAFDRDDQQCMQKMTFVEAKSYCEDKGMRTCGTQEIVSNVPANEETLDKGCWGTPNDPKVFWSHKPCAEDANAGGNGDFADRRRQESSGRRISYYAQVAHLGDWETDEAAVDSRCLPGHAGATEKALVACCADDTPVDTQFCRTCPANSCKDHTNECPADATANTDCVCDDVYSSYKFFNSAIDRFAKKISRPVCNTFLTDSPTASTPTAAPTMMEIYVFCVGSSSSHLTLEVAMGDTLDSIKTKVATQCGGGMPANEMIMQKINGVGPRSSCTEPGCKNLLTCDGGDCSTATLADESIAHQSSIILLTTATPTSSPVTESPTLAFVEAGFWVCDHINFASPSKGTNAGCYFMGKDSDGVRMGTSGGSRERCYSTKSSWRNKDLGSLINKHLAEQSKPAIDETYMPKFTCDDCTRSDSEADKVLSCGETYLTGVDANNWGVPDQGTVHMWPWTYCPTDTYRWGSRLPCKVDIIPWNGKTQTSEGWGPKKASKTNDRADQCMGWCKPPGGASTKAQETDVTRCTASGNYVSPIGENICVTSGVGGSVTEAKTEGCSGLMNFADAAQFCHSRGYRLCTEQEMQLSCTERTGCDYDYTFVWSMTECVTKGNVPGHVVTAADQRKWHYRNLRDTYMPGSNFGCGIAVPNFYSEKTFDQLNSNSFANMRIDTSWYYDRSITGNNMPYYYDDDTDEEGTSLPSFDSETSDKRYPYYYCDAFEMNDASVWAGSDTQWFNQASGEAGARRDGQYGKSPTKGDYGLYQDAKEGVPKANPYPSVFFDMFGPDMGWVYSDPLTSPGAYDPSKLTFVSSKKVIDDTTPAFNDFGQFCMADDTLSFVRCCADYQGSQCRQCEGGKTRTRGSEDFDNLPDWRAGGDGVDTWMSQECI